jgi:hypothetical protein
VVERILFLFVADFTACLEVMRTIFNYTERASGLLQQWCAGQQKPLFLHTISGIKILMHPEEDECKKSERFLPR